MRWVGGREGGSQASFGVAVFREERLRTKDAEETCRALVCCRSSGSQNGSGELPSPARPTHRDGAIAEAHAAERGASNPRGAPAECDTVASARASDPKTKPESCPQEVERKGASAQIRKQFSAPSPTAFMQGEGPSARPRRRGAPRPSSCPAPCAQRGADPGGARETSSPRRPPCGRTS